MIKTILRRVVYTLLGFVGAIVLWLLMAWLLPKIKVNRDFAETPNGVTIYVYSNGVHTDVILPVNTQYIDWRKQFIPSTFKAVDTTFQYVEIGWGDRGFYLNTPTWADLKASTAFKALFFLDGVAMHITYDKYAPKPAEGVCRKLTISPQQYQALINYIQKSFGDSVTLIPTNAHYCDTDNFYEAIGHYSFLKTCNVWTCGALKSAGVKEGLWTPLQGGVMEGMK